MKYSGRKLLLKKGSTVVGALRTKSFTINNEPIDVTTDDDDGYRKLLADAAGKSIDASFEGLFEGEDLIAAAEGQGDLLAEYTIELPSGGDITGDFFFASLEVSGEYEDAVQISGELQSSGEWTYTPASAPSGGV